MVTLNEDKKYEEEWNELSEIYTKNLNERMDKVNILKEWISKQIYLPSLTDTDLAANISIANESIEAAKELIDEHFTHRTINSDFYTNRVGNHSRLKSQLDLVEVALPPTWEVDHNGGTIAYARLIDTDASKVDFLQAFQLVAAVSDIQMSRGAFGKGCAVVVDMSGFHMGYLPLININILIVVLKLIQIFDNKITHGIVINCNSLISHVMALVRPSLSKSFAAKLHFFTPKEMNKFHELIPLKCIPSNYGGTLPSMTELNVEFRALFDAYIPWINNLDSNDYKIKKEYRREKVKEPLIEGSFRKLCID